MKINRDSDGDPCPVSDEVLGELYRASSEGLPALIAAVSPEVRAALASYCYRRGHLQGIGLVVASTCEEHDLVKWGGTAGAVLFARSRGGASARPAAAQQDARRTITLASGPLRVNPPLLAEPGEET